MRLTTETNAILISISFENNQMSQHTVQMAAETLLIR
jgi:hypothetical protein